MSEKINVDKVAKLARIKLTQSEEAYYEEKFKGILDYVGTLSEVVITDDLLEKDESLQSLDRPDQAQHSPIRPEDFSPYTENGFFKVPRVIE